jgi:hypothetical protein
MGRDRLTLGWIHLMPGLTGNPMLDALLEQLQQRQQGPMMPAPGAQFMPPVQDERARLREEMTAPLPVMAPDMGKEPGFGQKALATLADALSTYAAGIGGQPGLRTDFMGDIKRTREARRMSQAEAERQKIQGEAKSKQERAKLELERLDTEEARKLGAESRSQELATAKRTDLEDEARSLGVNPAAMTDAEIQDTIAAKRQGAQKAAAEAKEYEREYNLKLDAAKAGVSIRPGMKSEEILGAIATRERAKESKKEKKPESDEDKVFGRKQKDLLARAKNIAVGLKRGVAADEKTGSAAIPPAAERYRQGETPVQLLEEYEEELDALGLEGDARKEALDYFHTKVGSQGLKQPGGLGITSL